MKRTVRIRHGSQRVLYKPRFLMFGTLILGYKANKNSATHSKLCTC